jgi:HKD family nuclease
MIIRKLTVPLLGSNKIIQKTAKAFIATAAISNEGFDYIFGPNRLPENAHCKIVTGLHLPSPPSILRRILNDFSKSIELRIYNENFFHPKVYLFELKDGKKIGFVGSGNFSHGGFSGHEELFVQIDSSDEFDTLKEWFDSYFSRSEPISEPFIQKYDLFYSSFKKREEDDKNDLRDFRSVVKGEFNWNVVDFTDQYFLRDDYFAFEPAKARLDNPEIKEERLGVKRKLLDLHEELRSKIPRSWNIHEHYETEHVISSLDPNNHDDLRLRSMWLAYGRYKDELKRYGEESTPLYFMRLQVIISHEFVGMWLMPGKPGGSKVDREFFKEQMRTPSFRNNYFQQLNALGSNYFINIGGETKPVTIFSDADELWNYTKTDDWRVSYFTIGRNFKPGASDLKINNFASTVVTEFAKLHQIYRLMKDTTFE